MTITHTTRFQYPKADFQSSPWHQQIHDALDRIDANNYALLILAGASIYALAHNYVVGNVAYDITNDKVYVCNVIHTSHAANTFAVERAAHPTFWTAIV